METVNITVDLLLVVQHILADNVIFHSNTLTDKHMEYKIVLSDDFPVIILQYPLESHKKIQIQHEPQLDQRSTKESDNFLSTLDFNMKEKSSSSSHNVKINILETLSMLNSCEENTSNSSVANTDSISSETNLDDEFNMEDLNGPNGNINYFIPRVLVKKLNETQISQAISKKLSPDDPVIHENFKKENMKQQSKRNNKLQVESSIGDKVFPSKFYKKSTKRNKNGITYKNRRITVEGKHYSCDRCGKSFSALKYLNVHKKNYSHEKAYFCERCDKRFYYKSSLKYHLRTHTDEKPYSCEHCDKQFYYEQALKHHLRTHIDEKPYSCDFCDKRFNYQNNMTLHKRIHTGEKPYKCDYCGKSFTRQHHLYQHELTHTGQRPYECQFCGKSFKQQTTLINHEMLHTGETPFICKLCNAAFNRSAGLRNHQNRSH